MITKSQAFIYTFLFFTSCLSIFNHLRFEGSESHASFANTASNGDSSLRNRRDVNAKNLSFDLLNIFGVMKKDDSTATIREKILEIVRNTTFSEDQICKAVRECNCTMKPGPMGPTGPPGPPGKDGKRGLGLFSPRLRMKDLHHLSIVRSNKILKCQFFGNPIPSVRWKHDFSNTNVTIEINHNKSVITSYLHVKNITWDERGSKVTCIAESVLGSANATGLVTVHVAPIIHLPSGPIHANLGTNVTFPECKVTSNPPATITWKRGYVNLPIGRHEKNNTFLQIFNVRAKDEGYYVCEAENYLGKSTQGILLTSGPLQFTKKPTDLIESVNSSEVIQCSALGLPKHMSGKVVDLDSKKELSVNISTAANSFTLTAEITTPGYYKCIIQELQQVVESSFKVNFFSLPSSILTKDLSPRLAGWLKEENAFAKYALCWKGTRDGWNVTTFHQNCDNKPYTLTLMKSFFSIYGGYSDIAWSLSTASKISSKAFLFNLKYRPRKVLIRSGSKAICYDRNSGPCYGHREFRIRTPEYGYKKIVNTFTSKTGKSFAGTTEPFSGYIGRLSEIEVFYRVDIV